MKEEKKLKLSTRIIPIEKKSINFRKNNTKTLDTNNINKTKENT